MAGRFLATVAALAATVFASLAIGASGDVTAANLLPLLFGKGDALAQATVYDLRLPRTLTAALIGANFALSGLILQAITRNPLASPTILGVSQGAGFALALSLVFPSAMIVNLDVMAVLGGFAAGFIAFAFAGGLSGRLNSLRLILAGVAVGAVALALMRFTFLLEDNLSRQIEQWAVGDISDRRWNDTLPLLPWTLAGLLAAYPLAHRLNLLALGEDAAQGLGLSPRRVQLLGALIAAVLVGVSVAATGPVAFVGLIIPHIARYFFGSDHRLLIPSVMVLGAALLCLSDALSKLVNFPYETPVGAVAALIGAPWFLWRVVRAREIAA